MFKKGLILGGLLGGAALVGLAMTKRGKELGKDLQGELEELGAELKDHLANMEDVTKETFDGMVATTVDAYAKKKALAEDAKNTLMEALMDTWEEVEKKIKKD